MPLKHNLRVIPFFSDLTDDVLDAISQRLQREHYHKGATIVQEDDPGDCLYIIESGQVKVVTEKSGQEKIHAYLGPGNFFGEGSVLLSEKRSATVKVVIDVELLVLRRDDLEDLLKQHASIALTLTRELSRRLGRTLQTPVQSEEFNIVACIGASTPQLARYLAELTGEAVLVIDLGGLANVTLDAQWLREARVEFLRGTDSINAENLPNRLSQAVERYYWVFLAVAPYETPATLKAMELSDITLSLGAGDATWIRSLAPKGHWSSPDNEKSLRRMARKIAKRLIGIALSSGNARGFAHIGVLKVLEENNIPVDMIAGTSAGAVFGSLYAAGRSIQEVIFFAENIQRQYNFLTGFRYWDFRLPPRSGVIKGNMVLKYFQQWLANKTFDDLEIPLYIIAADVISGEEVVFDRGPVAEAVRASMSVIGIFEPAQVSGRHLIDGGAVNPVPSQLLADKGIDIILASSVIPNLEDRLNRRELKREGRAPNVIGIVMGAMEIMESEIIKTRMGPVDVLIEPNVGQYGTLEYDKVHEIIQRGEEAARLKVPHLKQLLAPRPRLPLSPRG
ncbi:MAG: cyclic nucleotide-binding domain-containing protein [Chloroflexi bacterium]|nr:cyclic nucleotide-binding domain-containing protein [Chloroflexota bacterium]